MTRKEREQIKEAMRLLMDDMKYFYDAMDLLSEVVYGVRDFQEAMKDIKPVENIGMSAKKI